MRKEIELITGEKPRCLGKDRRKAKRLNDEQWGMLTGVAISWEIAKDAGTLPVEFVDHLGRGHICDECRCTRMMGEGTEHEGIGYCALCEKEHWGYENRKMLDKSLDAVEKLESFRYRYGNKYLEGIRRGTPEGKGLYDLSDEINIVRSSIQETLAKVSPEYDGEFIVEMRAILEMGKEKCLDRALVERLERLCERIEERLANGFTESSREGPVPASDVTVNKVLRGSAETLAKLLSGNADIKAKTFITRGGFETWTHTVLNRIRSRAPDDFWFQSLVNDLMEIPDPR